MADKTIFVNGRFNTFDRKIKTAQAIAVEGGRIVDVGANTRLRPLARRGFKVVDLKRKCIIPAITDAHIHLYNLGSHFKRVNLDGVDSLDGVVAMLRRAASGLAPGQWLRGRGWNKNLWGERFPDKNVLDAITDNPVALESKDGHLLWVNSATLRFCGIDQATPDPPGGVIEKGEDGEPTGILKENAIDIVHARIPPASYDDKIESVMAGQRHLLKLGIVGVGETDSDADLFTIYHELDRRQRLLLRVFKMIPRAKLERAIDFKFKTGHGSEHLRTGCLKIFADGALGSQTAYMFRPYKGSKVNFGIQTLSEDEIRQYVSRAMAADISVAIHAIGDRANFHALEGIGAYWKDMAVRGLRPRIEHAQVLRRQDIPLFRKYGVIASVQPIHATSDRDIADRYWGKRARYAYPFRTFLKAGIRVAFGSDAPIETADPMAGIHAAVTRKRANENRPAWYPEERITVRQAIECYTLGSASACCLEDITGSISIGKRADFVVLSDDIIKIKPERIAGIEVLMTVVDGEAVYGRAT